MNTSKKNKTILICPLNWGLGHATRDIPIIHHFLKNNYKVIIGADKAPLKLLQSEFPELNYIKIPFPEIKYSSGGNMIFKMMISSPKLLFGIIKEHFLLKKIIKKHKIDVVISDNRYGLWNKNIQSIFITHQLEIQTPPSLQFLKSYINKINRWFISQYDECRVPDFEGKQNIAGRLSHPEKQPDNVRYIGLLSRFNLLEIKQTQSEYKVLVILSGPEPQRSIFQKIVEKQILQSRLKALIVLGKPDKIIKYSKINIDFINHLPAKDLAALIKSTPYIISRSGYSSIMDYITIKKTAILIPTPGQTEQEYLAKYLYEKGWFYSINQDNFNLKTAIKELSSFRID